MHPLRHPLHGQLTHAGGDVQPVRPAVLARPSGTEQSHRPSRLNNDSSGASSSSKMFSTKRSASLGPIPMVRLLFVGLCERECSVGFLAADRDLHAAPVRAMQRVNHAPCGIGPSADPFGRSRIGGYAAERSFGRFEIGVASADQASCATPQQIEPRPRQPRPARYRGATASSSAFRAADRRSVSPPRPARHEFPVAPISSPESAGNSTKGALR